MVLTWTIADVRYRFRVSTSPLPLQGITFTVVSALGILILLTDLWRAEGWLVPQGNIITPAQWQALLGFLFLFTFLTWAWFAFICPPVYGRWNAKRYSRALYRIILKGSSAELPVIADELRRSVPSLIRNATDRGKSWNYRRKLNEKPPHKIPNVTAYADSILLLIADRRLCSIIVESSPRTVLTVFEEVGETKKYGVHIEIFARNIVNEALANKDSFLFHETEIYKTGLIGHYKPLSKAIFSNYRMVEAIGTLLDPDSHDRAKWDAAQWEAYCRCVLMTFRDYVEVEKDYRNQSYVLNRAKDRIQRAAPDLYKINGIANSASDNEVLDRLQVVIDFINSAVEILDKKGVPDYVWLNKRDTRRERKKTLYDHLASMILEVISFASTVRSPSMPCWEVQHNIVWCELFKSDQLDCNAGKIVKFKVRRLIYDEVDKLKRFPITFKGARILGFCLNVMGFTYQNGDYDRDSRALQKAILSWTKKNYAWLHTCNTIVAEACLVEGMTYDTEHLRLANTFPAHGLSLGTKYVYFNIDPPPPDAEHH